MREVADPRLVALGVGAAMATLSIAAGAVLWQLLLFGGESTCPTGMCFVWLWFGFCAAAPEFVFGAIAAGLSARVVGKKAHATATEIWRWGFFAGLGTFVPVGFVTLMLAAWKLGYL